MSLAAEKLSFGYSARVVGRDVTLSIESGQVLALLGPNGGGKTTLLKTMLGLLPPKSGSVSLDGTPLDTISIGERARSIAYVPQVHHAAFAFTAMQVVMMGRTAHGGLFARPTNHDRDVAAAMLERLGIAHLADHPTNMISGGERQLVLIARALAQEPRYVVLDEPTASLDFGNQGKVMRQIRLLAESGLGVLFTTHDPNQALRHADKVALLRDGHVTAMGDVSAVLSGETLEQLYGASVETVTGPDAVAFLPG
ncbi:putative ABC transporter ATP-binding protein [Variibacter gotjawalensis]|uniref:Putative ABC transporter ATP-binding protein n=1 Tax=Variibacter gotjawalensis TaxID=1333996 RepID=A0A0S3PUZ4_9BRAD|nr:ABC transporter ATP-binding protein [Variibacter gotjawalensis]NIK50113.1 iron complex transport system ATP-binding protein [Variibacter gotjawalensis]RZS46111.1 iron complex transport system ATP-binding protein [Variibacter gotjawalensis]BAT59786.1 putative ABC transporter ATP-binding protein [Variibacter gotjawalensis]